MAVTAEHVNWIVIGTTEENPENDKRLWTGYPASSAFRIFLFARMQQLFVYPIFLV